MTHRSGLSNFLSRPVAVAIPVKDEAARIAGCLRGLARQRDVPPPAVALLLNNCRDDTAGIVRALAPSLPLHIDLRCIDLAPPHAHAGTARSMAMQRAAALAGPNGVILTTDADSVAPPGWLAENLAALAAGADAVAGRAVIDPDEARGIPESLHQDDARECAYAALLDEIASLLDPDPADPWPRHDEASGASLCVPVAIWRQVGGMAPLPVGEDRGFVETLRRHDCRIRHAPDVWVTVSGRTVGRAAGGMADTIRRRLAAPDLFLDDRLESAAAAALRASLRREARAAYAAGSAPAALAGRLGLDPSQLEAHLAHRWFGAAWAAIEAASPPLLRRRVAVADLERQARLARLLRDRLRLQDSAIAAGVAHPVDSLAAAAE